MSEMWCPVCCCDDRFEDVIFTPEHPVASKSPSDPIRCGQTVHRRRCNCCGFMGAVNEFYAREAGPTDTERMDWLILNEFREAAIDWVHGKWQSEAWHRKESSDSYLGAFADEDPRKAMDKAMDAEAAERDR